ncbi:hypothetical protein [Cupriavidus sp. M-11]|uniref:hypothetical protein n=1 Tax=Cupriavidus sp. M-11 TaxID=3233038 RepID=UPI003F911939
MELHKERVGYETIKACVLETYFDGCRDLAVGLTGVAPQLACNLGEPLGLRIEVGLR